MTLQQFDSLTKELSVLRKSRKKYQNQIDLITDVFTGKRHDDGISLVDKQWLRNDNMDSTMKGIFLDAVFCISDEFEAEFLKTIKKMLEMRVADIDADIRSIELKVEKYE